MYGYVYIMVMGDYKNDTKNQNSTKNDTWFHGINSVLEIYNTLPHEMHLA